VVAEAAAPHAQRGKRLLYQYTGPDGVSGDQPIILRRPEIVHGLRNFIQNAVDFAGSTVWIEVQWNDEWISFRVSDDGPGFPANVLPRLGDPFIRLRRDAPARPQRPGYEGMGLGLFIAKTLLERTGAEITFANGRDPRFAGETQRTGAVIEAIWPRAAIAAPRSVTRAALGENPRFTG
jgi:two-component system sensor histidine kinase RegB